MWMMERFATTFFESNVEQIANVENTTEKPRRVTAGSMVVNLVEPKSSKAIVANLRA
jgi:hypothetical protein